MRDFHDLLTVRGRALAMTSRGTSARRGRPPTDTVPVTARLPEAYIVALNAAIAREGDRHTRAQAVRFILRDWLVTHG